MTELRTRLIEEPRAAACLSIIAAYVIFLHGQIIWGKASFPYDYEGYHYPLLYYAFKNLREGVIPLWDSSSYSGMPFVHNLNAALFYPVHLFFFALLFLLGVDLGLYATQYLNIVHFLLGAVGFFLLLRDLSFSSGYSLLGSLTFISNGFLLGQSQHLGVIETIAWMPLALLLLRRTIHTGRPLYAYVLGLLLSMMFLIGFLPEFLAFLIVFLAYAIFLLREVPEGRLRRCVNVLIALALLAVIGAVGYLPVLEYLDYSVKLDRHGGLPLDVLLTALIPNFFDSHDPSRYWGPGDPTVTYFYSGLMVPLFLPLFCRGRTRGFGFFQVLLVVSFLVVFSPISNYLIAPFQHVPLVGVLLRPVNFSIYTVVSAIVLALAALKSLRQAKYVRRAALALLAVTLSLAFYPREPLLFRALPTVLVLVVIYGVAVSFQKKWKPILMTLFFLELALTNHDLFFHSFPGNPNSMGPHHVDGSNVEIIKLFQSDPDIFRISVDQEKLGGPWNSGFRVWGLESANGFDPLLNPYYMAFLEKDGITWKTNRTFHLGKLDSEVFRFLNIKYYLTIRPDPPQSPDFELVKDGYYKIYRYKKFTPRYLLLPSGSASIDSVRKKATVNVLPSPAAAVRVENYSTNERALKINSREDNAVLFLGEIYYPGWQAFVDGRQTDLYEANGLFMAAVVPRGAHTLRVVFRPDSFKYGALISVAGIIALIALLAGELIFRRDRF